MKKILLVNGSPRKEGCTYTALREVADSLEKEGLETEIFQIGMKAVHGCIACGKCRELGRCVFDDDVCNQLSESMQKADGVIIGSPVYYAGANGALCALLDRVFYSSSFKGNFLNKPAAAIVSCRRGGASATFDRLNKYFTISSMPVVSSQYWNSVHGYTPEDVKQDLEGLQVMRALGKNMAWLIKSIEKADLEVPVREKKIMTNYIR